MLIFIVLNLILGHYWSRFSFFNAQKTHQFCHFCPLALSETLCFSSCISISQKILYISINKTLC